MSSNIFEEVLTDVNGVEEKLLGPNYPYYKYINTPSAIGMSSKGSLSALGNDVNGLISYVEVLVSGGGKASKTGQALGNKFFLKTGAKCKDKSNSKEVDRYIYIDNVPAGNIPFISSGMGVNFSEFKGLIPGVMSNLNVLNPFTILQAFLAGGTPDCQEITMETIDVYNNKSTETHFVSMIDIQNMDPCVFQDKKNPISGANCKEAFRSMTSQEDVPENVFIQCYFASLGVLGIYIVYCLMVKKK